MYVVIDVPHVTIYNYPIDGEKTIMSHEEFDKWADENNWWAGNKPNC